MTRVPLEESKTSQCRPSQLHHFHSLGPYSRPLTRRMAALRAEIAEPHDCEGLRR